MNITNTILKPGESLSSLFMGFKYLKEVDITSLLTYNQVANLFGVFSSCTNLTQIINLNNLDVNSVSNANYMFAGSGINNIEFLQKFNNTRVRALAGMYSNCQNITDINIKDLNFMNCNSFGAIFNLCDNLETIYVDNITLNMSYDCTNWLRVSRNGSNLCDVTITNFNNEAYFKLLQQVSFETTSSSFNITLSNLNNIDITQLNMLNYYSSSVKNYTFTDVNMHLDNITYNNTRTFKLYYYNCVDLTNINITTNNVDSNINTINLYQGFYNCGNLTNINLDWNTSTVVSLYQCFYNCRNLVDINIDNWNVQLNDTIAMTGIFNYCENLVNVDLSNIKIDCSNNLMRREFGMFAFCDNLSNETVDSVINMCLNITNLNSQCKNLSINNTFSPFYCSIITNDRYQNRWAELTAAGWTY